MRPPPAPYGAPGRPAADAPPTAPYAARPTAAAPYVAAPRTGGSHVPPAFTPRPPAPARVSGVGPVESRDVALFDEDPDDGAGDDGATSPQEPLSGERRAGARKHRRRSAAPVRTGLLGASAAVALGAIAVTSGMLPGGSHYTVGGGPDTVHPADSPYGFETQGGTEGPGETGTPGDGSGTPSSPSAKHSSPSRSAAPSKKPTAKKTAPAKTATPEKAPVSKPPAEKPPAEPGTPTVTQSQSAAAAAAAQVLGLVNQERGKAGCSPVTADSGLADLATAFSRDMAARGFFDHTDPDGDDPWDRAKAAGISNLGGENIARGQADAQAVMESWMNSPGHRANILNCDYKTLGVGVYLGEGGPWWTQDFGF
ncbi:CAP domain-containing protein [Streptomyces sp. NPDC050560]|uniref:CAP domain-containing protein n=1 Tax=Streptomyces sp. NPDC050560 TaxID=3365630 RepID=UPI0037AF491C